MVAPRHAAARLPRGDGDRDGTSARIAARDPIGRRVTGARETTDTRAVLLSDRAGRTAGRRFFPAGGHKHPDPARAATGRPGAAAGVPGPLSGRTKANRPPASLAPGEPPMPAPKKVVLAYSGGLDTSIILKWLQTEYDCEVVTFTADLGQGEELALAREKAILLGIDPANIHIEDLRETFVRDFVFPMFRANAVYEGLYLLGTSIARPLIAQELVRIAHATAADAVAHGATGKGNDQVRFELSVAALDPGLRVIAPWREWDLSSRTRLLEFAEAHQIPIAKDKRGEAPFSVDANLLHTSSEGKVLEDPGVEPPPYVWQRTVDPEAAPDTPEMVEISFERGDPVAVNGERLSPAALLTRLNEIGGRHGVGRLDLVENRFVGMKSRGAYETPGGTLLLEAHRGIEQITLDAGAGHLKDQIMPRYAELIYNGFWFSPEREMLQALIDRSQEHVTGTVRVKLYKGLARTVARWSDRSLYSEKHVTFEEDAGAYDQKDAEGFIRLNALRLKLIAARNARVKG
jgi:argininosuccinate synthase